MTPADSDTEDTADVRRVLAGETSAFAGIVRRWQSRLVNLAWRFSRDRTAAEDMAQDAFVSAFRGLRTFRGESSFSTWLTAIALNSYRSWLRDRPPATVSVDLARLADWRPPPTADVEDRERASVVQHAVARLPPRYRDPIVLFYFQEMDLAETARVLGLREGTVKARLHRGRKLLERRLLARQETFDDGPER